MANTARSPVARANVLVVEDDVFLAKMLANVLERAGYAVELVTDGPAALERVDEVPFDVVICDWMLPTLDGTTLVRELRKRPGTQPAIILTSCAVGPGVRAHAERAGSDVFLAKPSSSAAILASLLAAMERRSRLRCAAHPMAETTTWRTVEGVVVAKLRECTNLEIEVMAADDACDLRHRASLSMMDVVRDTELRVALFAEDGAGVVLAKSLVGTTPPTDTLVAEVLSELSNNICGALKMAARGDGYSFTVGLPTVDVVSPDELEAGLPVATRCVLRVGGHRLDAIVGALPAPVQSVSIASLSEAMVLAEDVHDSGGVLVATKGTRLTGLTAERIARHAQRDLVRVCSFG